MCRNQDTASRSVPGSLGCSVALAVPGGNSALHQDQTAVDTDGIILEAGVASEYSRESYLEQADISEALVHVRQDRCCPAVER